MTDDMSESERREFEEYSDGAAVVEAIKEMMEAERFRRGAGKEE
jgi:hypothetical protein